MDNSKEILTHMIDIKEKLARLETNVGNVKEDVTEVKSDFQHYRREARADVQEVKNTLSKHDGAITFAKWAAGLVLGLPSVAYAAAKLLGFLQ